MNRVPGNPSTYSLTTLEGVLCTRNGIEVDVIDVGFKKKAVGAARCPEALPTLLSNASVGRGRRKYFP